MDLLLAVPLALVVAPFAAVAALLIRRFDKGPALYRAERVGLNGEPFTMYKFRTMVIDAESRGGSSTSARDPRITPIGHWMRRWKLDEIPQLINVLRGDMSLVGPRPQVGWDVARYTHAERRLLDVPPGITDWASIRFRDEGEILKDEQDPDEAYDRLIRPEKIRLGLRYVDEASLKEDLRILLETIRAVAGYAPKAPESLPAFSSITEKWDTPANQQQWALASQRYTLASELTAGGDLVEIGAGTGYGLAAVAPRVRSAIGVEPDDRNLATARANAPHLQFIRATADAVPLPDSTADCVAALEIYYYLPDQMAFLAEAARLLRPGGTLLMTMPNPERTAFSPSPFSTTYPTAAQLEEQLAEAGFSADFYGACWQSPVPSAFEFVRRALVLLRLMPSTIEGRARLKRLLPGEMKELGSIEVGERGFEALTPQSARRFEPDFALMVVVARRASAASRRTRGNEV